MPDPTPERIAAALALAEERFWAKVDRRGPDECWWNGNRTIKGYGRFQLLSDMACGAHRVSRMLAAGPIPAGLHVCHRCDNPGCVNPAHLFLATNRENTADKVRKGRQSSTRGERCGLAKLTEEHVVAIRAAHSAGGYSLRALARRFGVSKSSLWSVVTRETWSHVP